MNQLKLFVETLPSTKTLSDTWNVRYIHDIQTISGYEKMKDIAKKTGRYALFSEISEDGYSVQTYEETCDSSNESDDQESNEECSECCEYNPVKEKCVYDARKCIEFFVENVKNWNEVCGYHILFLQGKTPGTPDHLGSWHKETKLIMEPLIRILSRGILTSESQPGLLIYDPEMDEYIQKPYIQIAGPAARIHRILVKLLYPKDVATFDNSVIKYDPTSLEEIHFWGYKNYQEDDQEYVSVVLGIDNPPYFYKEYVEYLFSNRFFDYIAFIVETTS